MLLLVLLLIVAILAIHLVLGTPEAPIASTTAHIPIHTALLEGALRLLHLPIGTISTLISLHLLHLIAWIALVWDSLRQGCLWFCFNFRHFLTLSFFFQTLSFYYTRFVTRTLRQTMAD